MSIHRLSIPFEPNKGQRQFVEDRYIVSERHLIGGTGSGKTYCGVWEALSWMWENPGIIGIIAEPNYPMIRRNLIPILEKFLGRPIERNPLVARFNRGDYALEFKVGSKAWFISVEKPESAEGQSVDFWYLDEARLVRDLDTALHVLDRRLRGSGGNHPIGCWETTTPNAPGSALHKRCENPETAIGKVYRVSLFDNAANLPKKYIQDVVKAHPGSLGERFIYGRFADVAEGAFGFDTTKHVVDAVDKIKIRRWVYGVDFGWTNPAAIISIGLDGDGRAFAVDEYYKNMATDEELISAGLDAISTYGKGKFICDPSEPETIDKMKRSGINAEGNKSKREDGIRDIGSRLQLSGDRYRLYIHRRCVNLISEMQTYNPEIKANDHAVDALRYGLSAPTLVEPAYIFE